MPTRFNCLLCLESTGVNALETVLPNREVPVVLRSRFSAPVSFSPMGHCVRSQVRQRLHPTTSTGLRLIPITPAHFRGEKLLGMF
jgi:hypothetical protein